MQCNETKCNGPEFDHGGRDIEYRNPGQLAIQLLTILKVSSQILGDTRILLAIGFEIDGLFVLLALQNLGEDVLEECFVLDGIEL